MTDRLYYNDAYTRQFEARVVERLTYEGSPALVLDRSCFYPSSGGQPYDRGQLNGISVADVVVRESDGAVLHILEAELAADEVAGEIDWVRRFDHMQHHTGQHILTQAFIKVADAETVSFHLGEDSVTIDLNRANLTDAQIAAAEDAANALVTQNVVVRAWFPAAEEAASLPLRKVPDVNGKLRVVGIGDFDFTACGGTHVARTGEIGLIKVIRADNYKEGSRVEFRCGQRALRDYREKNAILHQLAAQLTTGYWEIGDAITRMQAESKQQRSALRAARQKLLSVEVAEMWDAAPVVSGARLVTQAWPNAERDPGELRQIASSLVERSQTVVLLGIGGSKAQLVLARSAELPGTLDMVALLHRATGILTGDPAARRGGGRPDFAQGGGMTAGVAQVQSVLEEITDTVRTVLSG